MALLQPVYVEVVTKVLTIFHQCRACEMVLENAQVMRNIGDQELNAFPEEIKEEFVKLSEWSRELKKLYKHRLIISLVDAQSILGIYKALRYRFRRTPTFIVNGRDTYTGWDRAALESILDRHMV